MKCFLMLFVVFIGASFLMPARADSSPVLNAQNVADLQSVAQIDFEHYVADVGEIFTGVFALSPDGSHIAGVSANNQIVLWATDGSLLTAYTLPGDEGYNSTVVETPQFNADGTLLASIHADNTGYTLLVYDLVAQTLTPIAFPNAPDLPIRVWFDADVPYIWVEVTPQQPTGYYVMRLPLDPQTTEPPLILPSAPDADETAFVRIGRIPAPLAITSSEDGLVKLWNLETGEVLHEVQLDGLPVFGRIDETTGVQLAWRDPQSTTLYLLNFETGENRVIAPLDGLYVQAFIPSPSGDIILGVHIGDAPIIRVWDTASGNATDLGSYRLCSRVPDLVRLSADGTTLVIGCDTGFDIWRIVEGES